MRAFRIAYDGRGFRGFQRQPDVPTVEDAIFDALATLDVLDETAETPPGYAAAGRTDAGVSALAQTIALDAPDWLTPRAFNSALPASIRAWAAAGAPADFHATHHATGRTYVYHLYAPAENAEGESAGDGPSDGGNGVPVDEAFDGGIPTAAGGTSGGGLSAPAVDDDRITAACEALSGRHDYRNLTPDDGAAERELSIDAARDGPFLEVTVSAGGFDRQLVRRLVSLVGDVGDGSRDLAAIDRVLDPESLPGHEGIAPADPEPLVLADVTYPDLEFRIDQAAARSARAVFDARRREALVRVRVSRQLGDGVRSREAGDEGRSP